MIIRTCLPFAQSHVWTSGGAKTVIARGMGNCTAQAQTTIGVDWQPSVSITSPVGGSTFVAPASFNITASASDPDGSVHHVDFYANRFLGVHGRPDQHQRADADRPESPHRRKPNIPVAVTQ